MRVERLADCPPVGFSARLEMRDVHWNSGCFADRDRLVDRLGQAGALAADVRGVNSATAGGDLCQLDQLRRAGIPAGDVNQSARNTPRPGLHRSLDDLLHPGQLVRLGARSALPMMLDRTAPSGIR